MDAIIFESGYIKVQRTTWKTVLKKTVLNLLTVVFFTALLQTQSVSCLTNLCCQESAQKHDLENRLENIWQKIVAQKTETSSAQNNIDMLLLFDLDGVIFPLGGSHIRSIDPKFVRIIRRFKNRPGVQIGVLTNRRANSFLQKDLETFKKAFGGLTFNAPWPQHNTAAQQQPKQNSRCGFKDGAFFVGMTMSKGNALNKILTTLTKREPGSIGKHTHVVFVDDEPTNLASVAAATRNFNFQLTNIHYVAPINMLWKVRPGSIAISLMLLMRRTVQWLPHHIHRHLVIA